MRAESIIHTIVLIAILCSGLAAFYFVGSSMMLRFVVGVVTSVTYVLWGIIYHILQKNLHLNVVIEYMLIGTIAVVLLAIVLLS